MITLQRNRTELISIIPPLVAQADLRISLDVSGRANACEAVASVGAEWAWQACDYPATRELEGGRPEGARSSKGVSVRMGCQGVRGGFRPLIGSWREAVHFTDSAVARARPGHLRN